MGDFALDQTTRRRRTLPLTLVVIAVNAGVLIGTQFSPALGRLLMFDGAAVWRGEAWRVFTHAWVHAGLRHLLVNMVALLPFGLYIEARWGRWRFASAYLLCCVGTGLSLALLHLVLRQPNVIGASGAVAGMAMLWLAGVVSRRAKKWYVMLPELALGVLVAVFYLSKMVLWDVTHVLSQDQISHSAHLAGFVSGFVLFRLGILPRGATPDSPQTATRELEA